MPIMHGTRTTVLAVLLFTAASGAAYRWTSGGSVTPSIPPIPTTIGDWVGEDKPVEVEEKGLARLTRLYTHRRTGRWFLIALAAGHPGLTAVHTPEYCYVGSGYEVAAPIARRPLDLPGGAQGNCWTTQFEKKSAAGTEQLRIFWTWSADGIWHAPNFDARFYYIGKPLLYKLYVVGAGKPDVTPGQDPQLDDFLASLLGTLNDALFAPPAP
jgi:hypothetical protein